MIVYPSLLATFADQARSELPNESVAIFSGPQSGYATTYHRARNSRPSASDFRISFFNKARILYEIGRAGEVVVAIVHSHPNGILELSDDDRAHAVRTPGVAWILYGPTEHAFAAFDSTGERISLTLAG